MLKEAPYVVEFTSDSCSSKSSAKFYDQSEWKRKNLGHHGWQTTPTHRINPKCPHAPSTFHDSLDIVISQPTSDQITAHQPALPIYSDIKYPVSVAVAENIFGGFFTSFGHFMSLRKSWNTFCTKLKLLIMLYVQEPETQKNSHRVPCGLQKKLSVF